jgi:hypothetical protein
VIHLAGLDVEDERAERFAGVGEVGVLGAGTLNKTRDAGVGWVEVFDGSD